MLLLEMEVEMWYDSDTVWTVRKAGHYRKRKKTWKK